MIVVIGSRHDPVATSMVEALPAAALCSAEDLTRPGWVWPLASPEAARWVVDGSVVELRRADGGAVDGLGEDHAEPAVAGLPTAARSLP